MKWDGIEKWVYKEANEMKCMGWMERNTKVAIQASKWSTLSKSDDYMANQYALWAILMHFSIEKSLYKQANDRH